MFTVNALAYPADAPPDYGVGFIGWRIHVHSDGPITDNGFFNIPFREPER